MGAVLEVIKTTLSSLTPVLLWVLGAAAAAVVVTIVGAFAWRMISRARRESRSQRGQLAYIQGLNHMLSGQTDHAVTALTRAVKFDGANLDAYSRLGTLFRLKGQPSRAVRVHKSLLMRPNLPDQLVVNAVYELALDYREAGDLEKAADVLQKVVTLDSNHAVALKELRGIYEQSKRWDEAIEVTKKLLRLSRSKDQAGLAPLHLAWGRDLLDKGNTDDALQAFRRAIKLNPQSTAAHIALGDALFATERTKGAIAAWERLMRENPGQFAYVLERLERAYFAAGQYDDLRKVYTEHLNNHPDDPTVRLALAEFYLRRGRLDDARKELQYIEADSIGSVKARLHLVRIHREEGSDDGQWRVHLESAMETLGALSRTFHCRACNAMRREYFWCCPKCDELETAARGFPPVSEDD